MDFKCWRILLGNTVGKLEFINSQSVFKDYESINYF